MTWGTFTPTHLASLASVGLFYVIMEWSLKRLPEKTQIWILGLLSLTGFAAGFYNLTTWGSPWEYLPLHLCSLNDWFIRAQITNPSGEIVQVNYMYSLYPTDPVLGMCWNLLPVPYWYMFLAVPIIIVYLALIYGIVYYCRHCRKLRSADR